MTFIARIGIALLMLFGLAAASVAAQESRAAGSDAVLTLEEAIRTALERNRELEDARLGLEVASGQVREAWGGVFPTVDLSASYTRNLTVPASFIPAIFFDPNAGPDELLPVRFGADNSWAMTLRAEQPLFQASAFLGVGAADRYATLQREVVRGEAQAIATRVRTTYYDVLLAQEALRVAAQSLARVEQTLAETQAMHNAGLASEYDVLRLQVEKSNLEPNVRRARNGIAAATRTLAVELGMAPTDSLRLEGSLMSVDLDLVASGGEPADVRVLPAADGRQPAAAVTPDLIAQALADRSDIRQLQLWRSLRQTEIRVEQSEFLPKVSLFGVYQINAQHNGDPDFFGESARFRAYGRQVGVQVTMPLFNGFRRPARLQQKEAELERVETQASLARAAAEHEVKTLTDQRSEALARAQAQRLAVQQAQRGYQIARAQYREGISGQLEVTDAELALRQSEYNYAQAVYDYLVARAQLDRALGRVQFVDDGATAPHNILLGTR